MSPAEKAEHAASALANPALLEALEAIRSEIFRLFASSGPADSSSREYYYRLHEASAMFERCLRGYLETGKLEAIMEQQDLSPVERVKRGLSRFLA